MSQTDKKGDADAAPPPPAADADMLLDNLTLLGPKASDAEIAFALGRCDGADLRHVWAGYQNIVTLPVGTPPDLYGDRIISRLRGQLQPSPVPHVYALANLALVHATRFRPRDQLVLVAGAAGSGKTHQFRNVLDLLTSVPGVVRNRRRWHYGTGATITFGQAATSRLGATLQLSAGAGQTTLYVRHADAPLDANVTMSPALINAAVSEAAAAQAAEPPPTIDAAATAGRQRRPGAQARWRLHSHQMDAWARQLSERAMNSLAVLQAFGTAANSAHEHATRHAIGAALSLDSLARPTALRWHVSLLQTGVALGQSPDEGNFHIFYHFLHALESAVAASVLPGAGGPEAPKAGAPAGTAAPSVPPLPAQGPTDSQRAAQAPQRLAVPPALITSDLRVSTFAKNGREKDGPARDILASPSEDSPPPRTAVPGGASPQLPVSHGASRLLLPLSVDRFKFTSTTASSYALLARAAPPSPAVSSVGLFNDLVTAFRSLQIADAELLGVFDVLAGLLHLGNVNFASDGDARPLAVANLTELSNVASLWQVPLESLQDALVRRTVDDRPLPAAAMVAAAVATGQSVSQRSVSLCEAQQRRDNLVESVYAALVEWICGRINAACQMPAHLVEVQAAAKYTPPERRIWLWDIGAHPEHSLGTLQQLCTDYTAGRLHELFFERYLVELSRAAVLDGAINEAGDGNVGVKAGNGPAELLLLLGPAADTNLATVAQLSAALASHGAVVDDRADERAATFTVRHYSTGSAEAYLLDERLLNQRSVQLEPALREIMARSTKTIVVEMFGSAGSSPARASDMAARSLDQPTPNGDAAATPNRAFRPQGPLVPARAAADLVTTLLDPLYSQTTEKGQPGLNCIWRIICVGLGKDKVSPLIEPTMQTCGIPVLVRSAASAWAHAFPLAQIRTHYGWAAAPADLSALLQTQLPQLRPGTDYAVGKTHLWLRSDRELCMVEHLRRNHLDQAARRVQGVFRGYMQRRRAKFKDVVLRLEHVFLRYRARQFIAVVLSTFRLHPFSMTDRDRASSHVIAHIKKHSATHTPSSILSPNSRVPKEIAQRQVHVAVALSMQTQVYGGAFSQASIYDEGGEPLRPAEPSTASPPASAASLSAELPVDPSSAPDGEPPAPSTPPIAAAAEGAVTASTASIATTLSSAHSSTSALAVPSPNTPTPGDAPTEAPPAAKPSILSKAPARSAGVAFASGPPGGPRVVISDPKQAQWPKPPSSQLVPLSNLLRKCYCMWRVGSMPEHMQIVMRRRLEACRVFSGVKEWDMRCMFRGNYLFDLQNPQLRPRMFEFLVTLGKSKDPEVFLPIAVEYSKVRVTGEQVQRGLFVTDKRVWVLDCSKWRPTRQAAPISHIRGLSVTRARDAMLIVHLDPRSGSDLVMNLESHALLVELVILLTEVVRALTRRHLSLRLVDSQLEYVARKAPHTILVEPQLPSTDEKLMFVKTSVRNQLQAVAVSQLLSPLTPSGS